MRKHLKYIFITIIALLTVFVGGGLSYFYFSPVDGASFDKDIGINNSTDQIYENYSFSNEKDKDHSYTLYFFPSVYYMGIYKAYLDDPVHNPKPEEAFGSFSTVPVLPRGITYTCIPTFISSGVKLPF